MSWTLPNILTLARICLTPVLALLPFIQGYWPKVIAFLIFIAASASDVVDGYLARRHNQVSELGQLLDPIADKLLLFATLIPIFWLTRHPTILVDYRIPWWGSFPVWVALLLVGRELLMTGFRFFAKRRGVVIPAMGAGKLKAVVQNVFIGATLFWFAWKDALAAELGRALAAAGAEIIRRVTVADRPEAIRAAVAEALERTGFVLTTGGLGPTRDDMTKTVVAELFGKRLVVDDALLAGIEARFQRLGRPMPAINRTQAQLPEGATILPNPRGTAPGLWIEDARGRVAVLLPGVPREMRGLLVEEVLPRLVHHDAPGARPRVVLSRTVRTTGVPESALAERLGSIEGEIAPLTLAYLPSTDGVDLRLTAWSLEQRDAETRLTTAAARLQQLAGEHWYGHDEADLAAVVLEALRGNRQRLGVAESCTGGMVVTGIAGPGGGTPEKPVGTVWLAARVDTDTRAVKRVFPGDREEVRRRGAQAALDLLRRLLARA